MVKILVAEVFVLLVVDVLLVLVDVVELPKDEEVDEAELLLLAVVGVWLSDIVDEPIFVDKPLLVVIDIELSYVVESLNDIEAEVVIG